MEFFRKIAAGLVKHDINQFVGEEGNIFFSVETGEFRLSDGVTPGGIRLGTGSGGSGYTLLPARTDRLGGVKIGANINVGLDGTISIPTPFNGRYDALIGTPDLSGFQLKSEAFDGDYNSLINKPVIPTVPTFLSQLQNDTNFLVRSDLKSVAFTGSYNDLTDKPAAPTFPTNISYLANDAGYITSSALTWGNITGKPSWAGVAFTGSYTDLTNKPTIPTIPTNLTAFVNDAGYVTSSAITWDNLTGKPTWAEVAFTGDYTSLRNRPTIPTDVSQLTDNTSRLGTTIPSQIGNAGKFLTTDGTGAGLSWASINIPTDLSQLTDIHSLLDYPELRNVQEPIIPGNTATHDLGTSSKEWRDLYLSNKIQFKNDVSVENRGDGNLSINAPYGVFINAPQGILFPDGTRQNTAFTGTANAITNFGLKGTDASTGTVNNNDDLLFKSDNGVTVKISASTNVTVNTPQDLQVTASPTFNGVNVGAEGVKFADGTTMTTAAYGNNSGGGGSGGATTGVIKTFNIVGSFAAPVPGTAVFVPFNDTSIRSIQLVNSEMVVQQLQVGLYKNGLMMGLYSIVPGNMTSKYTALDLPITTQDRITCSVLSGFGNNFSLVLSSSF